MRFTQPDQIPKAMATLTLKDQAISIILTEEEALPIQVPTKYIYLSDLGLLLLLWYRYMTYQCHHPN